MPHEADNPSEEAEKIAKLFDQLETLNSKPQDAATQKQIEKIQVEIVGVLEAPLRREVIPRLARMLRSGAVDDKNSDRSMRYTELSNEFFAKILLLRTSPFWRARAYRGLIQYSAKSMFNIYRDHYRKSRGTRRAVPAYHDSAPREVHYGHEAIKQLVNASRQHFESSFSDLDHAWLMETIDEWEQNGDENKKLWARFLQLRYVRETEYKDIANHLDYSLDSVYNLKARITKALKEKASREGH